MRADQFDVVVVGAGPAGVGTGLALARAGVENFILLDRHEVGATFDRWPAEMRFITPSFNSNQFGWLDMNACGLQLSVAFSTGREYAKFLRDVVAYFKVPVRTGTEVTRVLPLTDGGFNIQTSAGEIRAKFVVWAAGEFQYPKTGGFPEAHHCIHNSTVPSWRNLEGDNFVVIGGSESGIDAAVSLVACGKSVRVLDSHATWDKRDSDPSVTLSTYTLERLRKAKSSQRIELLGNSLVAKVRPQATNSGFEVQTTEEKKYLTPVAPILATGFDTSLTLVRSLFDWSAGRVKLTSEDESEKSPGLFLVGPQVFHDKAIFCFIYKFRQRFAVVVDAIARRLGLDTTDFVALYRSKGMFLDDLSCCGEKCEC